MPHEVYKMPQPPRKPRILTPVPDPQPPVCAIPDPKLFSAHWRGIGQVSGTMFTGAYDIIRNMRPDLGEEATRLNGYLKANQLNWSFTTDAKKMAEGPVTATFLDWVARNVAQVLNYITVTEQHHREIREARSLIDMNERYLILRRQQELAIADLDLLEVYFEAYQKSKREFGQVANQLEQVNERRLPLAKIRTILAVHVEAAILVAQVYALNREKAELETRVIGWLKEKRASEFGVNRQAEALIEQIRPILNGSTPELKRLVWPDTNDMLSPPTLV